MSEKVLILLDADVVIHLFKAGLVSLLQALFPNRIAILDIVLNELRNNRTVSSFVDNLFVFSPIQEIAFPMKDSKILAEFAILSTSLGKGEAATLIFCKYNQHIIASSNTSEIKPYCEKNSMAYLTTLDLLVIAVHKSVLSETEANVAIKEILSKDSFLICNNLVTYQKQYFDKSKLMY